MQYNIIAYIFLLSRGFENFFKLFLIHNLPRIISGRVILKFFRIFLPIKKRALIPRRQNFMVNYSKTGGKRYTKGAFISAKASRSENGDASRFLGKTFRKTSLESCLSQQFGASSSPYFSAFPLINRYLPRFLLTFSRN